MSDYFNGTGTIGFTCDNCGRELLGCTWVNGMKFCAKCYQETFGNNTSQFVDLLNKEIYELKIADLEAKLAESEERYKKAYREGLLQKKFDKDMEIDQLKQQLARSRNAIDDLKNKLNKTREELEIANNQILFDNTEFEKLNKQLAEKEINITNEDFEREVEKAQQKIDQDKIQFAIEKLEKVKEFADNMYGIEHAEEVIEEFIDNQINELKEGK